MIDEFYIISNVSSESLISYTLKPSHSSNSFSKLLQIYASFQILNQNKANTATKHNFEEKKENDDNVSNTEYNNRKKDLNLALSFLISQLPKNNDIALITAGNLMYYQDDKMIDVDISKFFVKYWDPKFITIRESSR